MKAASLILTSMRPGQWVKNTLVFAPLIFAMRVSDPAAVARVSVTFVLFCVLSGGVYLINDVLDRTRDREHPLKKQRPVASGALPARTAASVGSAAALLSVLASLPLGPGLTLAMAAYLALNFAYSRFLKNLVIIDVMAIAAGFLLRVVAGALAIPVAISFWLLLCTGLLALFLAFGKRRHELVLLEVNASSHRPILDEYSPYFLDQLIGVASTSTVVAYALYTISPDVREKLGTPWLGLTIPFVLYGIFRYLYLIHQKDLGGNPTETILTDPPLLVDILLWAVAVLIILSV
jgi:4-hydroxybenzoate polyprenyltransferase